MSSWTTSGRLVVHSATGCRARRPVPYRHLARPPPTRGRLQSVPVPPPAGGRVPCSAYWPRRKVSVSRATCGCFSAGRSRSRMASAFWAASTSPGAAHPRGVATVSGLQLPERRRALWLSAVDEVAKRWSTAADFPSRPTKRPFPDGGSNGAAKLEDTVHAPRHRTGLPCGAALASSAEKLVKYRLVYTGQSTPLSGRPARARISGNSRRGMFDGALRGRCGGSRRARPP